MFEIVEVRGPGHVQIICARETIDQVLTELAILDLARGQMRIWDWESNQYVHIEALDEFALT